VLCLENTWHGKPLPLAYAPDARALCDERGLALHLDGARLFNAAVAQGVPVRTLVAPFHSVSVCLSKGLGAPVGSVLLGSAELIARGKRLKKLLGGGWRQAGMLAAAALHALDHHVERLADDHRRARDLAAGLAAIPGLAVEAPQTNLVFVTLPEAALPRLRATLHEYGLVASVGGPRVRLATHLDIDDAAIARAVAAFAAAMR
jgi:threonine aldolase